MRTIRDLTAVLRDLTRALAGVQYELHDLNVRLAHLDRRIPSTAGVRDVVTTGLTRAAGAVRRDR